MIKFEHYKKLKIIIFIIISTVFVIIIIYFTFLFQSLVILIFLIEIIFTLPFFKVSSRFKRTTKIYETLSKYHSDGVLQNYPFLEVITNKYLIHFEFYDEEFPLWCGHKISHAYVFRKEFKFLNIERLPDICKYIKPKKERYEIGLLFNLPEYNLFRDDEPNQWLN